jgi:hypothetical protein
VKFNFSNVEEPTASTEGESSWRSVISERWRMLAEVRRAQPSRAGVNGAQAEIGKKNRAREKRPVKF